MTSLLQTERAFTTGVIFLVAFLVTVGIGRLLKRRAEVRLGVMYQLFCLALAFYLAIWFYGVDVDFRNHVGASVALLSTAFFIALIDRYLWDVYFEKQRHTPIPHLLRELFALVIFLIALLLVLSFGYHAERGLKGLLAGSGIVAIVLGIAGQNLFGGIIAGISIQINRPYKVGDWLLVHDKTYAEVMEINWRSTRLRTNDNIYLDIPNNEIVRTTIVNLHYPTQVHAMRIRVGVDYNVPPNRVKDALFRATSNAEGVLHEPKPRIFLVDFADSAVLYEIKFCMGNHSAINEVSDAIRTNVWYELRRQNIAIPYPIRTLHLQRRPVETTADVRDEARAIMRNEPLFHCLEDDQINRLVDAAQFSRFGRGERIIEEGAPGESMFVLVRGSAQVSVTKQGEKIRVGVLRTGDCFGEMSMLTGEARSANVRADGDCEVLEISKDAMADIFQEAPECLNTLSDLLAKRRLETEGIVKDASQPHDQQNTEREYRASFLKRVKAFFQL